MPFQIPLDRVRAEFPEYTIVRALTPSEQKAAFHVRDQTGLDLCLKIIAPNYDLDRLTREIHALQRVNHPNVVRLEEYTYSSKPTGLRHYMIEEFVEGSDLADLLILGRPWDPQDVIDIFAQLCDGLAALRSADVVHRDLKPHNIRIRPNSAPVIIDFGLARHLTLPDLTGTGQGAAIGTPAYFAPEQFEGTKRDIDHRTDLFAVGVMMYEAMLGEHPFYRQGMSYAELSAAVCHSRNHSQAQQFVALPRHWRLLLDRLLEKERARRPSGADQVAAILRKIGAGT